MCSKRCSCNPSIIAPLPKQSVDLTLNKKIVMCIYDNIVIRYSIMLVQDFYHFWSDILPSIIVLKSREF